VCSCFLCVLFFMFKLFFFKCFSNFPLSRLTFTFNFCPLLLLTTNYCDIYKPITACTFVAAFNKLYCIVPLPFSSTLYGPVHQTHINATPPQVFPGPPPGRAPCTPQAKHPPTQPRQSFLKTRSNLLHGNKETISAKTQPIPNNNQRGTLFLVYWSSTFPSGRSPSSWTLHVDSCRQLPICSANMTLLQTM